MLVERVEGVKLARAQVAFVCASVPRTLCRPGVQHLLACIELYKPLRVCENAVTVEARDSLVDHAAIHARRAGAGFEVDDQCGTRDK